jgi:hypothetical protein
VGPDDVKRLVLLQVVNVIGSDHTGGDVESQKNSPFTGEPWLDMDVTIPGSLPDG